MAAEQTLTISTTEALRERARRSLERCAARLPAGSGPSISARSPISGEVLFDLPAAGPAGVTPASGGAPETSPAASGRRPSGLSAAWLLLVPAGLALYMGYLWQAFHDALLFGSVQSFWGRELTFPGTAVWNGARTALRSLGWLAAHGVGTILGVHTASGGLNSDVIANLLEFIGFVVAVALLVACWRRLSAAYTLYALAALLFPLLYSTAERPLYSLPRFVVVVFPLFMGMAAVLAPRPVWRWVATAVFVLLLLGSTVLFASFI